MVGKRRLASWKALEAPVSEGCSLRRHRGVNDDAGEGIYKLVNMRFLRWGGLHD